MHKISVKPDLKCGAVLPKKKLKPLLVFVCRSMSMAKLSETRIYSAKENFVPNLSYLYCCDARSV